MQWRDFIEMELKKIFLQSIIRQKGRTLTLNCSTVENNAESEILLQDLRIPAIAIQGTDGVIPTQENQAGESSIQTARNSAVEALSNQTARIRNQDDASST